MNGNANENEYMHVLSPDLQNGYLEVVIFLKNRKL